jgi:hypothetical protein
VGGSGETLRAAAGVLALAAAAEAHAQRGSSGPAATAAMVPRVDDAVDRDLELLRAFGLLDPAATGQRPHARRTVARLLGRAAARLQAMQARGAAAAWMPTAERLLGRYGLGPAPHPAGPVPASRFGVEALRLLATATNSRPQALPPNGLGGVDAVVNPLADGRDGRRIGRGVTVAAEAEYRVAIGAHLAAQAVPRIAFMRGDDGRGKVPVASAQEFAIEATAANARLALGLLHRRWGQGADGGLALGPDAPPLPMAALSNDRPVLLPGVLRRIGPVQGTLLVAGLGRSQNFPGALLAGYKVSVLPTPGTELGVAVRTQTGGRGAPGAPAVYRVADLVPVLDVFVKQGGRREFSNKLATVDARASWPRARGLTVFGEVDLNDAARRWRVLWDDAAHRLGVRVPRVTDDGRVAAAVEVRHTGVRQYEHNPFTSGMTSGRFLLGDGLGARAHGAYLAVDLDGGALGVLRWHAAAERRGNDRYVWDAVAALPRLAERRVGEGRVRTTLRWEVGAAARGGRPGTAAAVVGGLERVVDAGYVAGARRSAGLIEVLLTRRF